MAKILYLARHRNPATAEDEAAIGHALESLGHEVIRLDEPYVSPKRRRVPVTINKITEADTQRPADFLLFHHYGDFGQLAKFPHPKCFWYFDRVTCDDPTLAGRSQVREAWLQQAMQTAGVGFCTDGDAVARHPDRLVFLPQGCDERVAGRGAGHGAGDILFTGIARGGVGRESFVAEMRARYAQRFMHVERGFHGRDLANLVASHPIVVAPDAPVSDRYASNRVWLTLGYGGFLLHPWCDFLQGCYRDGKEIVYYRNRAELHAHIAYYLGNPEERQRIAQAGLQRTLAEHTYRHRAAKLIEVVRERLL